MLDQCLWKTSCQTFTRVWKKSGVVLGNRLEGHNSQACDMACFSKGEQLEFMFLFELFAIPVELFHIYSHSYRGGDWESKVYSFKSVVLMFVGNEVQMQICCVLLHDGKAVQWIEQDEFGIFDHSFQLVAFTLNNRPSKLKKQIFRQLGAGPLCSVNETRPLCWDWSLNQQTTH